MDEDEKARNDFLNRQASFHLTARKVESSHTNEKFVRWIVFHPCKLCCTCFGLTVICMFLMMASFENQIDQPRSWLIQTGTEIDRWDSRIAAVDEVFAEQAKPVQSQEAPFALIGLYFRSKQDQILTPANVDQIKQITDTIANDTEYRGRFCLWDPLTPDQDCSSDTTDTIIDRFQDKTQDEIDDLMAALPQLEYKYFGKDVGTTNESSTYVAYLRVGFPMPNCTTCTTSDYSSILDNYYEQAEPYNKWMRTIFDEHREEDGDLEVWPMSFEFYQAEISYDAFSQTNLLLILCIYTILFYVMFHTQSIWLGALGLFQILICFAPAFVAYWYVLGVHNFGIMNTMIIFVILGIGADDMFVMTDAWVQSSHVHKGELERMSYAFNRASKAMAITSLTTACAFFATTVSRILPIKAFGLWAGWVILFNYLYFITMYPSLLMIQHYYPKLRCCFMGGICPCKCCKDNEADSSHGKAKQDGDDFEERPPVELTSSEADGDYRCIENCFKDKFSVFIVKWAYAIFAVFFAIAAVGIYAVSQLSPPEAMELSFREGTYYDKIWDITLEPYSDPFYSNIEVVTFWGISGVDRSQYSIWQSGDGDAVWDDDFDLTSAESQQHIYDLCQALRADTSLSLQSDNPLSFDCFMEGFKEYVNDAANDDSTWPKEYATQNALVADLELFLASDYGIFASVLNRVGIKDGELKFVEITARSQVNLLDALAPVIIQLKSDYRAFIDDWNSRNVAGVSNADVTSVSEWAWPWKETEPYFSKGASQGVAIALPMAFLVLLLFTQNIFVSVLAVITIFGIMLNVAILFLVFGWHFGVVESIALVVVIGFSVDYVVHLGHAYLESKVQSRSDRSTMSLLVMGISVTSGAFTTALSGIPLTASVFNFFYKMGLLIVFTCSFALAWSLFFFMAILGTYGPTGDSGNVCVMGGCKGGREKEQAKKDLHDQQDAL